MIKKTFIVTLMLLLASCTIIPNRYYNRHYNRYNGYNSGYNYGYYNGYGRPPINCYNCTYGIPNGFILPEYRSILNY